MKLKAAFRLFDKWLTREVRLSLTIARHRCKGEQFVKWGCNENERQRWIRHCDRLLALKARWFLERQRDTEMI